MDVFSKLPAQFGSRFRALSVQTRLVSLLLAVIALSGIVLLTRGGGEEAYEPLLDGRTFSYRDIVKMTAAFRTAGLLDSKVVGNQVHVPRSRKDAYLVALETSDALPADFDDDLDQVMATSNILLSRQQSETNYRYAEQKKLARIVASMNGIEGASVQYDEVKKPGFPPTSEIRAFVAVRAVGRRELAYEEIEAIRDTVAGYVAGLDRQLVTVTDLNACRAYSGSTGTNLQPSADYAGNTKRALECEFRSKIQQRLAAYPGAVVRVNVHLAENAENGPNPNPPSGAATSLSPTLVTAAVELPQSSLAKVWPQGNALAGVTEPPNARIVEQQARKNIEDAVLAILPPPAPELRGIPQVTVTTYQDNTPTAPVATSLAAVDKWPLPQRDVVVMASVVVLSILALVAWKWRATPTKKTAQPDTIAHAATGPLPLPSSRVAGESPPTVRADPYEEINEMVKQDPQAAADLLRRWLGKAA